MIIFIESNTSGTGEYFYQLCKKKKINFKFLVKSRKKYQWLEKSNLEIIDTTNTQELEKKINEINIKNKIRFILSTSDQFVVIANQLNKKFKIKCEDLNLLKIFKDKFKCLKIMNRLGISNRKNFLIKNKKDKIQKIAFPCIVKPNSGTGSIDVYKINNLKNLRSKIRYFLKKKIDVLVEEYIEGEEYSLEILFLNKKIIFEQLIEKKINDKTHFVESGHIIRPKYNQEILKVKNKILKKIKKFKMNKIFLHIEFKIDAMRRVQIIEINPRLAGGFIPILIKESTGFDLINYFIDLICNKKIAKFSIIKAKEIHKIIFLIPPKSKKINKIYFSNKIKYLIINKKLYEDKIKNFKRFSYNFSDRLGHIIFKSKNNVKLKLLEGLIRSNIRYSYKS